MQRKFYNPGSREGAPIFLRMEPNFVGSTLSPRLKRTQDKGFRHKMYAWHVNLIIWVSFKQGQNRRHNPQKISAFDIWKVGFLGDMGGSQVRVSVGVPMNKDHTVLRSNMGGTTMSAASS